MNRIAMFLSVPVLVAFATLAPAQSTDVKQPAAETAKLEALTAQVKALAESIKSAEWEIRLKKLESEIQNLKDASIRIETLAKSEEGRRSFYNPPAATKPLEPLATGTLRLVNSTALLGTITINGKEYTVLPLQTVLIPGMPAGEFRYEARVEGFGLLQPVVSRTLTPSEMFTITLYPR